MFVLLNPNNVFFKKIDIKIAFFCSHLNICLLVWLLYLGILWLFETLKITIIVLFVFFPTLDCFCFSFKIYFFVSSVAYYYCLECFLVFNSVIITKVIEEVECSSSIRMLFAKLIFQWILSRPIWLNYSPGFSYITGLTWVVVTWTGLTWIQNYLKTDHLATKTEDNQLTEMVYQMISINLTMLWSFRHLLYIFIHN